MKGWRGEGNVRACASQGHAVEVVSKLSADALGEPSEARLYWRSERTSRPPSRTSTAVKRYLRPSQLVASAAWRCEHIDEARRFDNGP